eukprot:symbB.v1.2.016563.t2/scaffold1263.1/size128093/3
MAWVQAQRAASIFPAMQPLTYQGSSLIAFAQQQLHQFDLLTDQLPIILTPQVQVPVESPRESRSYAPWMSVPRSSPCFAKMASSTVSSRPVTREDLEKSGNFLEEGPQVIQSRLGSEAIRVNGSNMDLLEMNGMNGMKIERPSSTSAAWIPRSGCVTYGRKYVVSARVLTGDAPKEGALGQSRLLLEDGSLVSDLHSISTTTSLGARTFQTFQTFKTETVVISPPGSVFAMATGGGGRGSATTPGFSRGSSDALGKRWAKTARARGDSVTPRS